MTLNLRPLWLLLGGANLVAGVAIALRPAQSFDVGLVAQWCRDWLIHGLNPYPGSSLTTNYPPYAIALLSPLLVLPEPVIKPAWALISAALAVLIGWLGIRWISGQPRRERQVRLSLGVFLAWESLRIGLGLGQFTLVALAAGLAAVVCQGKIWRGLLLGIAMIKPQIAAAFMLWAILESALTAVLVAALPVVAGTLLFAVRLGENPFHVIGQYGNVLRQEMGGQDFRQGALELRPLMHAVISSSTIADIVHVAVVVASLILLVVVHRRMSSESRALFLLPLTCVWTLMSVYHPTYDLVLLWPVAVAVSAWQSDARPSPLVAAAMAGVQIILMIDVPGLWWKLNGRPLPSMPVSAMAMAIQQFDRLLVLGLFAALITVSIRWQPANAHAVTLPSHAVPV